MEYGFNPNKILVKGRAGAGKDVFADYLVENHGFTKLAFADGIYDIAYNLFDMKIKDRKLLQNIGQKMREIDPNIWAYTTLSKAKNHERVVISDCRQANEYDLAIAEGFTPVEIISDVDIRLERLRARDGVEPNLELLENESETGADEKEFIPITNNTTLDSLYIHIEWLLNVLVVGETMEENYNNLIKGV